MELMRELEDLVEAAITHEVSPSDIERWQDLFGFTHEEAQTKIENYRDDVLRTRLSEEQWDLVAAFAEGIGHDRESYEYSLSIPTRPTRTRELNHEAPSYTFLVELDGPVSTMTLLDILDLTSMPQVLPGQGIHGDTSFCKLDNTSRIKLLNWLDCKHPDFRPTIIRLSQAQKDISSEMLAPSLGIDTTMPQFRPTLTELESLPGRETYPVWYFLYGSLTAPDELQNLLGVQDPPEYAPACVYGGEVKPWRETLCGLVDADPEKSVAGYAFSVKDKAAEEAMRFYYTDKYEVVRCKIEVVDITFHGFVFRFASPTELQ